MGTISENLEIIKNQINLMKSNLGLEESASLMDLTERTSSMSDFTGVLPNNPVLKGETIGTNSIKVYIKAKDASSDGTRIYYQQDTIPENKTNDYVDIPNDSQYHIFNNLQQAKNYGFKAMAYKNYDGNKKAFNNSKSIGSSLLYSTLVISSNGKLFQLDIPSDEFGASIDMCYSPYTDTLYMYTSNKNFYKINSNYEFELLYTGTDSYPKLLSTSYGIFFPNYFYDETDGNVYQTNRSPVARDYNYVNYYMSGISGDIRDQLSNGDVISGNSKWNNDTHSFDNYGNISGSEEMQIYDEGGNIFIFLRNGSTMTIYKWNGNGYTLIASQSASTWSVGPAIKQIEMIPGNILAFVWGGNEVYFIKNDTLFKSNIDGAYTMCIAYDNFGNIFIGDKSNNTGKLYKIGSDLTSYISLSTSYKWNNFIIYKDHAYLGFDSNNSGDILRVNSDNTIKHFKNSKGTNFVIGPDGYLYVYDDTGIWYLDEVNDTFVQLYSQFYGPDGHHFIDNDTVYIFGGNNYNNGVFALKNGAITDLRNESLSISYSALSKAYKLDSSHIVFIQNSLNSGDYQFIYDISNKTTELSNYFGGLDIYKGIFLNNSKEKVYGKNTELYTLTPNETYSFNNYMNNQYFSFAKSTNKLLITSGNQTLIILKGGTTIFAYASSEPYEELGYIAKDNNGNDVTTQVIVDTSQLDLTTPGVYPVIYSLILEDETTSVIRTIVVGTPYEWELPQDMTLLENDTFVRPSAKLYQLLNDGTKVDISSSIIATDNVDTSSHGNYNVTYTSNEVLGISTSASISVIVLDSANVTISDYNTDVTTTKGNLVTNISTTGNPIVSPTQYVSSPTSLYMDGSSYIDYSLPNLTTFDIEFSFFKANSESYSRLLYLGGINREVEVNGASNNMYISGSVSADWKQNNWNIFRITRDSSNVITYYCNGNKIKTETNSDNLTYLRFGQGSGSSNRFTGYYDDLTIMNNVK